MRLWFDHSSEVTLHEQIVTQIRLGVLSGELNPGARLPSLREIARRFHIHPNTVSAAYRQLSREGWVEGRRGSGMYARRPRAAEAEVGEGGTRVVDHAIQALLLAADRVGMTRAELRERVLRELEANGPRQPLLIEPDAELGSIVAFELRRGLGQEVGRCAGIPAELRRLRTEVIALVLPSKAEAVRRVLGDTPALVILQINPIAATLAQHLPKSREALLGIASCWPGFLQAAKTMLVAAGYSAEALVVRDAREADWEAGLERTDALICDSLTAGSAGFHRKTLSFPLIANESLEQVCALLGRAVVGNGAVEKVP